MPDLVRLAPGVLTVGKPLPWPVYDQHGHLLVAQGHVIQNESQLERLYANGRYDPPSRWERPPLPEETDEEALEKVNPFREYAALLVDLERTVNAILNCQDDARIQLISLARRVSILCRSDAEAALALIHVYAVEPTAHEQTLFYAILCWFMAQQLDLTKEQMMTLLAAALTANIALLPYQDKLNHSRKLLTDQQRTVIRKHPLLSAQALARAGMENKLCLKVIEQHHEEYDGSGYPQGLRGKDILREARVLAVAERYIAMITLRAYRQRCRVDEALRSILTSAQYDPDKAVYQALFRALGVYPPGVLVALANGETAVVIARPTSRKNIQVKTILNSHGHPYLAPFYRDTEQDEWAVQRNVIPDMLPPLDLPLLWNYD